MQITRDTPGYYYSCLPTPQGPGNWSGQRIYFCSASYIVFAFLMLEVYILKGMVHMITMLTSIEQIDIGEYINSL